jgi:hypothetical protein
MMCRWKGVRKGGVEREGDMMQVGGGGVQWWEEGGACPWVRPMASAIWQLQQRQCTCFGPLSWSLP